MWDEYKREHFDLRALLFVTINDWPALSNLSGHSNKGYNACTHCYEDLDCVFLKKCRKVVYLGHRRFLPMNHLVQKKGKHFKGKNFKGKADNQTKPLNRTGDDVLEMVKDIKVVFGKGRGSEPIPKEYGMKMTGGEVTVDKEYGMTTVDLNNSGFKDEPFVLAQVFYVKDMSTKPNRGKNDDHSIINEPKRHIVLSG